MADALDDLEDRLIEQLKSAGMEALLPTVFRTLDAWLQCWGGERIYVARRATRRRHADIKRLDQAGLDASTIAATTGVSVRQVRRLRKSSYL